MPPQRTWSPESEDTSATSSSDAPVTHEQPGRYELGREFGRGGQARVLLAMDRHLGREVAWKELLAPHLGGPVQSASGTATTRFLREARITGLLEHPNIVPVHELGARPDGSLYYTMRVVRGETLDQRLLACRDLDARLELLGAFWDMCNAIAFAHSKGVIHRDLKPSNVMVGEFGETVVLDWGLAKVHGSEDPRATEIADRMGQLQGAGASETIAGWAVGTPSYMSPEQADGDVEAIDERSDVWGLGAVLYALLTGRPPFEGNNPYHVVAQVRTEPVQPVASLCPGAPPELVAVATKALQRDRALRYQSARELAEEVSAYMTGRRVAAYEYSSWELLRRFAARNKAAVSATGAVMVAVLVSLVLVAGAWQSAEQARAEEYAQRLQAHFVLAQAYGLQSDRMLQEQQALRARIFAAASQLNNPANPAGPFHDPGFGLLRPDADRLLVKASSRLYQSEHRHVRRLEARIPRRDALMDVAFSPDGRLVATAEFAHGFTVREVATGQDLMSVPERGIVTYATAFFPDGERIATGGKGPAIQVWKLGISEPLLTIEHPQLRSTTTLAVSPDGRLIASRGGQDLRSIAIWDADDGSLVALHPVLDEEVAGLAFAPDGSLAIAAFSDPVRILDPRSGEERLRIPVPAPGYVYWVAYSPDGERLLGAATDGTTRIWSTRTGEEIVALESHVEGFYYGAFSPDGARVATAGSKGTVGLWSASNGQLLAELGDHSGAVSAVAFSPDGSRLASAGYDKLLRLWSLDPDDGLTRWSMASNGYRMAYDPSGARFATAGLEGQAEIFDQQSHARIHSLTTAFDTIRGLAFSPDGTTLAVSGRPDDVELYDATTGTLIANLRGHDGAVWGVAFSPDGRLLATGSADQSVRLWDLATGSTLHTMTEPDVHLTALAFSSDGSLLAAVGGTSELWVWRCDDGALLHTLEGHSDWVQDLAWIEGTHQFVSAGRDKVAILWDADGGQELRRFTGHPQGISALALHSPSRLATVDRDGTVLVWHLDLAEPALWLLRHTGSRDIAFSPDGQQLTVFDGSTAVAYPMGHSGGGGDPATTLAHAERDAGLELDGFELVVP